MERGGGSSCSWVTIRDPYKEESGVGTDVHGDTCVIVLWSPVGYISLTFVLLTQLHHYMRVDTTPTSCLRKSGSKRANILRLYLRYNTTSL